MGLLFGLACGIGLAFVLESLDTTVRNMGEVSAISMLPALGTIPLQVSGNGHLRKRLTTIAGDDEKAGPLDLITYVRPKSEAAEAYRALRTSILLSSFGAPPKVDSRHQRVTARRKNDDQCKFCFGLGAAW